MILGKRRALPEYPSKFGLCASRRYGRGHSASPGPSCASLDPRRDGMPAGCQRASGPPARANPTRPFNRRDVGPPCYAATSTKVGADAMVSVAALVFAGRGVFTGARAASSQRRYSANSSSATSHTEIATDGPGDKVRWWGSERSIESEVVWGNRCSEGKRPLLTHRFRPSSRGFSAVSRRPLASFCSGSNGSC
jgi:hypothetical protein